MTEVKDRKEIDIKTEESSEVKEETKNKPEKEERNRDITLRRERPLTTFRSIDRLFNEMTSFFNESFWRPFDLSFPDFNLRLLNEEPFFRTPLANITEEDDMFKIKAELPGLDKGDLEVAIKDGMLEIKGEKKEEHEEKKKGFIRKEYSSSSYFRRFKLPENIDNDKIDATLNKGLLEIKLPKKEAEEKKKKRIEVN